MSGCQKLKEIGKVKLLFNGDRVAVWEVEKILEMNDNDGCTIMWIYLMPCNWYT